VIRKFKESWIEARTSRAAQSLRKQNPGKRIDEAPIRSEMQAQADALFQPVENAILDGAPLPDVLREFLKSA